jgi:hypothetical protein
MKTTVTLMPAKAAQTEEQFRQVDIGGQQYRFNTYKSQLEYRNFRGEWVGSWGFGGSASARKTIADLILNPTELVEVVPETPEEIVIEIRVSREEVTELQATLAMRLPYGEHPSHLVNAFTDATRVKEGASATRVS